MNRQVLDDTGSRFEAYVQALTSVIGYPSRSEPLKDYCVGLLAAEGRKSVEPMAALTAPATVSAQHQKLLHFVANAGWSDARVLFKVQELAVPAMERHGPIEVWIIDDTSFPKKGSHSVGVHHQYCGELGKQANCQVVVTLSIANHEASLPIAYRLYLPQAWAENAERRKQAHIPENITFKSKPQIALEQFQAACAAGVAAGVALMDPAYGTDSSLRSGIRKLERSYVAGVWSSIKVRSAAGRGDPGPRMSVKEIARSLPRHAWRTIKWREGTNDQLRSRFARVRVHASPTRGRRGQPEETLLIEWPEGEAEPTHYWLSNLDKNISRLVDLAKMRWRIERDYQDLKQEIGLGHYEGRGWRGFHHHGSLCIAAYGFLISEQGTIPPSGPGSSRRIKKPIIPNCYRPRGAPDPARTSHPQFARNPSSPIGHGDRQNLATLPVLCTQIQTKFTSCGMTQ
jgi:SRSO17 transposase